MSGYADSSSTSEWARDTYIDYFGNAGGTMFVIDMRNRNLYIINRGSVKDTITSAYSESITDNVYTYASDGDYYTCAEMVFTQELTLLQGGRISQPMKYITAALVAVVLAILVNFIFVRLTAREVKPKQSELFDASIGALGVAALLAAEVRLVAAEAAGSPAAATASEIRGPRESARPAAEGHGSGTCVPGFAVFVRCLPVRPRLLCFMFSDGAGMVAKHDTMSVNIPFGKEFALFLWTKYSCIRSGRRTLPSPPEAWSISFSETACM